jgi:predicted CopG family antitoxin
MKRVTILLSPPIYEKLRLLAFQQRKSMSETIREWVEEKLKEKGGKNYEHN